MAKAALKIVDELPDWQNRSALEIHPAQYLMRNGRIAEVLRRMQIPYVDGVTGKPAKYVVWFGQCICCKSGLSWNVNGTYAAVGKHEFDLMVRA